MPTNVLVLWRDSEAKEFEAYRCHPTSSVGKQMRHRRKGDRLFICSTVDNELFLLGVFEVRQVVEERDSYLAKGRSLSGVFRRLPLGETKWQLRFVHSASDRLRQEVSISSQVQTNRHLSDQSADLLCEFLGGDLIHEERERRFREGERRLIHSLQAGRNSALRVEAKRIHGLRCYCCGFHFEEFYGDLAKGVGLVHHLHPLGEGTVRDTTLDDVRIVCANCHHVLHLTNPPLEVQELRRLLEHRERGWTERGIPRHQGA